MGPCDDTIHRDLDGIDFALPFFLTTTYGVRHTRLREPLSEQEDSE